MFRPQIQKTRVMLGLAIFVMLMVFWAVNSYEREALFGFALKKKSVEIFSNSIESIRKEFINRKINLGKDQRSYGSFLIGPRESIIQTTSGSFISKQSVLNPDFAAIITEMLIELDIDSLDNVAVAYTGSYPGANLAVLSALEALQIPAVIISSCGSSEYGATFPEITWIDMEKYLFNKGLFSNRSTLASIGGGYDLGTQFGSQGKKICESSIYNNKIELLNIENPVININKRMNHYIDKVNDIALFINVGGGIYSVGDSLIRSSLPPGIIYPGDLSRNLNSTIMEKFLKKGIPAININHINILCEWYKLPYPPSNNDRYGIGNLFYSKKQYNSKVIMVAFILATGVVIIVGIISHNEIKKRMHSSEPDSFL